MAELLNRARDALSSKASARVQLFVSAVLFGLMAVSTRFLSRDEEGFSAGQTAVVRFAVGAGLMLLLFRFRPGTFRPVNGRLLVTRGLLGGVAAFLYFVSLAHISAGKATLLNTLFPLMAIPVAFFTLRERPTVHLAVAIVMTTAGVYLVLGGGTMSFGFGLGELAGIGSAIVAAGAATSIRALRATDNAPTIFFAFCLGGLVVSWPFAMGSWPTTPFLWLLMLVMGLLSFGAQLLMTQAYGSLTVPEAAVWQQLTPVAAHFFGLVFLSEKVTGLGAIGVLLGLGGVVYATLLGARTAGRSADPLPPVGRPS